MDRTPRPGERYRHFQNHLYQVITIAKDSETGQALVIYQALYGDYGVYARPLEMFVSEVDHEKYPQAAQKYQFELVRQTIEPQEGAENGEERIKTNENITRNEFSGLPKPPQKTAPASRRNAIVKPETEDAVKTLSRRKIEIEPEYENKRRRAMEEREHRREQFKRPEHHETATEELNANPNLLRFLDTDTYEQKYEVLTEIQDDMTDRLVDDIAVVLDVVIPEGNLQDRVAQLKNILLTRRRYELNRFRT